MFMKVLMLGTALTISAIAAYYSIIGLATIFAAAVVPVIIMGSAMEIGKLVTVVYLHRYWDQAQFLLKSYLMFAVFFLMFITSMGIFGFLSKAHIEQTALSDEQVALAETIDDKLSRSEIKIERWDAEINRLLQPNSERVDIQIGNEQETLNGLYDRIADEKAAANDAYNQKLKTINETVTGFGSGAAKREQVDGANAELKKELTAIDRKYNKQIKELEEVIKSYRITAESKTDDIDGKILVLETNIEKEQVITDELIEQKMVYEKEFRKLEAEVGPVKYIAELVYGEANKSVLEDAVRWVIIILCIVFDPLAVALLIAWNGMIEQPKRGVRLPEKKLKPSDDARYYWKKIKEDAKVKKHIDSLPEKREDRPGLEVVKKPTLPIEKNKEVDPDNEPYNPEAYELRSDIKEIIKKKDTENPK